MLKQNERKQLKALAAQLTIRYQLGKKEIGPTVIDMFDKALTAHELIKIDVMKSVDGNLMEIALDLSSKLNADIVDLIGRVIILFRRNKENPKIRFKK